jgi:hypothetical protein
MGQRWAIWSIFAQSVLLIAISGFGFDRNAGYLFPGGDGSYILHDVLFQHEWTPFSFGLFANPLQGFDDISFPINTRFFPALEIPFLALGQDSPVTLSYQVFSHVIFSLELFLTTLCAARAMNMGWTVSSCAAWLVPLLSQPYFGFPLLYPILMFAPTLGTLIAGTTILLIVIMALGRQMAGTLTLRRRDLVLSLALLILMAYVGIAYPTGIIFLIVVVPFYVLGLLIGAENRNERIVKLIGTATAGVAFLGLGFGFYILGLFSYTATRFWSGQFEDVISSMTSVSVWYTQPGRYLMIAAAIGGILLSLSHERRVRFFAITTIVAGLVFFGFGTLTVWKDFWRGPAIVYFEAFLWPFYSIFACAAVIMPLQWGWDYVSRRWPNHAATDWLRRVRLFGSVSLILIIPTVAFVAMTNVHNSGRIWGDVPPPESAMITQLKMLIGLKPGQNFRGRVTTLLAAGRPGSVGWYDLIKSNVLRINATGNDYFWSGLWFAEIPTLFEYTPLMSPAFFHTAQRLLGRGEDLQMRSVIVLRGANAHNLALFGVRFIISDAPLPEPFALKMSEQTTATETLRLYEVPNSNLGTFSPVAIRVANSLDETLAIVGDADFDARHSAVVFDSPEDPLTNVPLVPATMDTIQMNPGTILVKAHSSGTSLLVLPFEFSRCLTATPHGDSSLVKLVRVNALQVGVIFEVKLDAEISYYTGPFANARCRLSDGLEFSRRIVTEK